MRIVLAILVLACAGEAWAQDVEKKADITRMGPYLAFSLERRTKRGQDQIRSAPRYVTWVGFQMAGQGGRSLSRYELAVYDGSGNLDEVIIELTDTVSIQKRCRRLDTAWLLTAVLSVKQSNAQNRPRASPSSFGKLLQT